MNAETIRQAVAAIAARERDAYRAAAARADELDRSGAGPDVQNVYDRGRAAGRADLADRVLELLKGL